MKKILIVIMAFMLIAGLKVSGYCQDESADASAIDQTESQMGRELDSEISSDEASPEAEVGEMEESMDTGGATN